MRCIELTSNNHFQLSEKNIPTCSADQVLIKVAAASLNPVDYKLADGSIPIDKPAILGHELSGIVEQDSTPFKKGEQIIAYLPGPHTQSSGALAEYVAIPKNYVCKKPNNLRLTDACAYPLPALTAYQCFTRVSPQAGKTALVVGANGAVGLLLTQLLIHSGISVTALVRSEKAKQTLLQQTKLKAENITLDKTSLRDMQFDYCFDLVGGELKTLCFKQAAFRGHVVSIVEERDFATDLWDARQSPAFAKSLSVHFVFLGAEAYFGEAKQQAIYSQQLEKIKFLIEEGVLHYSKLHIVNGLNSQNLEDLLLLLKNRSTNANKLILEF